MLIQTIQPVCILETIKKNGFVHAVANFKQYDESLDWGFSTAYDWMKEQMLKHHINPQKSNQDLFWGWAWSGDRGQKKVDLRTRRCNSGEILLTLDKPDNELLLSEFSLWHHVLNYWPICLNTKQEEFWNEICNIKNNNFYEQKPLMNIWHNDIVKSWDTIFNIKQQADFFLYDLDKNSFDFLGINPEEKLIIQATFWDIKSNEIVNVQKIN